MVGDSIRWKKSPIPSVLRRFYTQISTVRTVPNCLLLFPPQPVFFFVGSYLFIFSSLSALKGACRRNPTRHPLKKAGWERKKKTKIFFLVLSLSPLALRILHLFCHWFWKGREGNCPCLVGSGCICECVSECVVIVPGGCSFSISLVLCWHWRWHESNHWKKL